MLNYNVSRCYNISFITNSYYCFMLCRALKKSLTLLRGLTKFPDSSSANKLLNCRIQFWFWFVFYVYTS